MIIIPSGKDRRSRKNGNNYVVVAGDTFEANNCLAARESSIVSKSGPEGNNYFAVAQRAVNSDRSRALPIIIPRPSIR